MVNLKAVMDKWWKERQAKLHKKQRTCSLCPKLHFARGYCDKHYKTEFYRKVGRVNKVWTEEDKKRAMITYERELKRWQYENEPFKVDESDNEPFKVD